MSFDISGFLIVKFKDCCCESNASVRRMSFLMPQTLLTLSSILSDSVQIFIETGPRYSATYSSNWNSMKFLSDSIQHLGRLITPVYEY